MYVWQIYCLPESAEHKNGHKFSHIAASCCMLSRILSLLSLYACMCHCKPIHLIMRLAVVCWEVTEVLLAVDTDRQRWEMITASLCRPESLNTLHPHKTHTGHASNPVGVYTRGEKFPCLVLCEPNATFFFSWTLNVTIFVPHLEETCGRVFFCLNINLAWTW